MSSGLTDVVGRGRAFTMANAVQRSNIALIVEQECIRRGIA
jgi:hypothetical protein